MGRDLSEHRFDAATRAVLPGVGGVLAAVVVLLAMLNATVMVGETRTAMLVVATASGAFFLTVALLARTHRVPDRYANPLLAAVCLVATADTCVSLAVSHDAQVTTNLLVVAMGAGAFVLDRRWYLVVVAAVWLGWGVALSVLTAGSTEPLPHGIPRWALALLATTLLGFVVGEMRRRSIDRYVELLERAQRASVEDPLTGLLNRRGLGIVGQQVVAAARRSGNAVHCVFVDVDGLKDVNDRLGHAAGDRVLVAVSDAIRLSVRSGDVVSRWGGDEFCVLGPGPGTAPLELERRIVERIAELPPEDVPGWASRVSAGSAMLAPWDDGDLPSLLEQADREMYRRRALRRSGEAVPTPPVD